MDNLIDRTRAHLEGRALCLSTFEGCEDFALLHAESQFNASVRFRLWIDGHECLFWPVCDGAWHVKFAFNTGKGCFITCHYYGRPAGSIKTFDRLIRYARACLPLANGDLIEHLQGYKPIVAHAGPKID